MTRQALWTPSPTQREQSRLADFIHYINQNFKQSFSVENYASLHQWSVEHREQFWSACFSYFSIIHSQHGKNILHAGENFWQDQWFPDTQLNFAENLLYLGLKDEQQTALSEWNEQGHIKNLSYKTLIQQSQSLAEVFKQQGVKKNDRVAACLPNASEAVIAMLACASIGAIWSSCSPDFGTQGMLDRFSQITPKILVSCLTYQYNGKIIDVSEKIGELCAQLPSLRLVITVDDKFSVKKNAPNFQSKITQLTFSDCIKQTVKHFSYEQVEFNHPLYIMFSSGTTGVPKCIVHGTGGTLIQHLKEHQLHCNLKQNDNLFFFTTCGWMMWNWLVSGLASKAKLVLFDGSPFYPEKDFLFEIAQQEQLTHMGVGAKYIASLAKENISPKISKNLSSMRVLLSTGSPLSSEGFEYVYEHIKSDVNLASISGGTDIISCFALGNPALPVYAGEIQCKGLGMDVDVFDEQGHAITEQKGELVCKHSFPSMPIGFWNDAHNEKFHSAYFSVFDNIWAHGDYAEITAHKGIIIHGRSDAVLNPGGVRIGTAEIYRQVEKVEEVLESIVVAQQWQDDVRILLFVVLRNGKQLNAELVEKIKQTIRNNATPRHVPALILQAPDIPRTKSGKIVELAVRNAIHGEAIKNTEALANPEALEFFKTINLD